ncbi:MAG: hypothetical protein IJ007_04345 [Oscillospiraceae bacterium]|nr:hypothetical protein [Oscillospiraceae bacterium]
MADRITELYIRLERRMKALHESNKLPDGFFNTYACVCRANAKCIQEQNVYHKFMTGIRPEELGSAKELPAEMVKILERSFPLFAETGIAGGDLANLVVSEYNACCQYGKALSNQMVQLYRQTAENDSRMAEILKEFEDTMLEINKQGDK